MPTFETLDDVLDRIAPLHKGCLGSSLVRLWQELAEEVISQVGIEAFVALYEANLYRCQSALPSLRKNAAGGYDLTFDDLKQAIEDMEPATARCVSTNMLSSMLFLLNSLVGGAITASILKKCWGNASIKFK